VQNQRAICYMHPWIWTTKQNKNYKNHVGCVCLLGLTEVVDEMFKQDVSSVVNVSLLF